MKTNTYFLNNPLRTLQEEWLRETSLDPSKKALAKAQKEALVTIQTSHFKREPNLDLSSHDIFPLSDTTNPLSEERSLSSIQRLSILFNNAKYRLSQKGKPAFEITVDFSTKTLHAVPLSQNSNCFPFQVQYTKLFPLSGKSIVKMPEGDNLIYLENGNIKPSIEYLQCPYFIKLIIGKTEKGTSTIQALGAIVEFLKESGYTELGSPLQEILTL